MDRGAARSRKRTEKVSKDVEKKQKQGSASSNAQLAKLLADKPDKSNGKGKGKGKGPGRPPRKVKSDEDRGPDQYKAKAVRAGRTLVYSEGAFAIPPPAERLEGVTRVDLEGSGCDDVSWLPPSVTWLSVKGCPVTAGWDVVGSLKGLTVLNISSCGLSALPAPLGGLGSLKALVAMGNDWSALDEAVVAGWKELNSLIVSHSPNLACLPASLASLPHLAKLAFSHCPRLDAAGLADLSPLPLLRDVKANNLARLATLPAHLAKWGTGDLALVGKATSGSGEAKLGDGLEVLDLGNCSLSYSAVSSMFGLAATPHAPTKKAARWPHLRSLTLRANPLAVEVPAYAEQLQASTDLPKLQIIDARRVKERARAGEVQESRRERLAREKREKKAKPTGANEHAGGKPMRKWGAEDETEEADSETTEREHAPTEPKKRRHREVEAPKPKEKKRKLDEPARAPEPAPAPEPAGSSAEADAEGGRKKRKRKHGKSGADEAAPPPAKKPVVVVKPAALKAKEAAPAPVATHIAVADPAAQRAKKPSRSETAVVGVVDVKKAKGGLDLKAALGKGGADAGSGLGVGGW